MKFSFRKIIFTTLALGSPDANAQSPKVGLRGSQIVLDSPDQRSVHEIIGSESPPTLLTGSNSADETELNNLLEESIVPTEKVKESAHCLPSSPLYQQDYGNITFDDAVRFSSMAVFGDSYSDVGNIYHKSNETAPSPDQSWNGRYSDGPIWIEYLSNYFNINKNDNMMHYAWGGATTNTSYIPAYSSYLDGPIPGVDEQIQQYLLDNNLNTSSNSDGDNNGIDNNTLHVLWSGYNDYWWYVYRNYTTGIDSSAHDGTNDENYRPTDRELQTVASDVVQSVMNNVRTLYENGAKQFLIMNTFNMSTAPEALAYTSENILDSYEVLMNYHNQILNSELDQFIHDNTKNDEDYENPSVIVYRPNVYHIMDCISINSVSLGMYDTANSFYGGEDENKDAIFTYKWWDAYHPTTHTHQLIASDVIQSMFDYHYDDRSSKQGTN